MSDFLQFKDEIIDGNAKYFVTDNADGTKNIELANEIVQQGTPSNRANLNKLNAILGYNEMLVEKVDVSYTETGTNDLLNIYSTSTSDSVTGTTSNPTSLIYSARTQDTMYSGEFKNIFDGTDNTSCTFNYASGFTGISRLEFSYQGKIKQVKAKKIYIRFELYNTDYNRDIIIYGKKTGAGEIELARIESIDASAGIEIELNNTDYYDYYMIGGTSFTSSNLRLIMYSFNITEYEIQQFEAFKNEFTITQLQNEFTNNQRVLVETSSTTDLTDISSNTINGIACDTLLQPSTKYELIYNEDTNKFETYGILYDIILTEPVSQVDLVGISNKMQEGKIYAIYINDLQTESKQYEFGSCVRGYPNLVSYGLNLLMCSETNYTKKVCYDVNESNMNYYATITDNEYIKMYYNSGVTYFNAGTRIIIKEID